jgi:ABC-type nickel/cobalt efflux system permease component RcnA
MTIAEAAAAGVVSIWDNPTGRATTILTGVLATLTALTYVIRKLRELIRWVVALARDIAAIKHEVKNDHTTNFREEQDERHGQNAGQLGRIDRKLNRVLTILGDHDDRIEDLEHTRPRRPE